MDCSLSGSSVHGIFQARVLECPLFHTGDHSPIASSGPHPVLELLCGVGGARVDSMEYRPWQFQACNLFFCFLILSNKNVFTFRRNESILLSKPPFSIWSMLDVIVIHEYRESFSMQYNSMYFKLRNYKTNSLINFQIPLKLNFWGAITHWAFGVISMVNRHSIWKGYWTLLPYPSARQCETAFLCRLSLKLCILTEWAEVDLRSQLSSI